jgi:hypothetical protein
MTKYSSDKRPPPTPKRVNPWDVRARANQGDTLPSATFEAVGRALSSWESFEEMFSYIFSTLVGTAPHDIRALRAYGSILTFKGRAEMISAACEAFFFENPQAELEAEINAIVKAAVNFSSRRNEIAHGKLHALYVPGDVIGTPEIGMIRPSKLWGFSIIPPSYATNKRTLGEGETLLSGPVFEPDYAYAAEDLNYYEKQFTGLEKQAANCLNHLIGFRTNVTREIS